MHLASRVLRSGVSSGDEPGGVGLARSFSQVHYCGIVFVWLSFYFPLFPLKMMWYVLLLQSDENESVDAGVSHKEEVFLCS